jgi:tungstate transport system ATP-binding protein
LEGFEKRNVQSLSGGESQRVAIARIIVCEPEIIILDEPTTNLDPSNTVKIETAIKKINENYSTTVLLATHNMFQAKRLATRLALLYEKRIVEIADKDSFFNHPKDPLTKAFINGDITYS